MITVALAPAELPVGDLADLTVQVANPGPGACTRIIFTLSLPREIMLVHGHARIEVASLEPGKVVTRSFRVRPLRAARCQVTTTNFSYRDQYGRTCRNNDFRAEIVTRQMAGGDPGQGETKAAPTADLIIELGTDELPYGKWARIEGVVVNSGDVELCNLELGLLGPVKVAKWGRWVTLGTLPAAATARFRFYACADQPPGSIPMYFEASFDHEGRRVSRRLVEEIRVSGHRDAPSASPDRRTILFFGSNPDNTERLRIDREYRAIAQILEHGERESGISIRPSLAAQPDDIFAELVRREPWIVHLAGHGAGQAEGFIVEDDDGYARVIRPDALAKLFESIQKRVACVIINACSSERTGRALARHVQYVIVMREPIYDWCAIEFSTGFYQGLAANYSIEGAFRLGVAKLMMKSEAGEHEIPRLLGPPG
jgi:hypothetical protein